MQRQVGGVNQWPVTPFGAPKTLEGSAGPTSYVHRRTWRGLGTPTQGPLHDPGDSAAVTWLDPQNVGLVTFTAIERIPWTHHPKKVTFAELSGRYFVLSSIKHQQGSRWYFFWGRRFDPPKKTVYIELHHPLESQSFSICVCFLWTKYMPKSAWIFLGQLKSSTKKITKTSPRICLGTKNSPCNQRKVSRLTPGEATFNRLRSSEAREIRQDKKPWRWVELHWVGMGWVGMGWIFFYFYLNLIIYSARYFEIHQRIVVFFFESFFVIHTIIPCWDWAWLMSLGFWVKFGFGVRMEGGKPWIGHGLGLIVMFFVFPFFWFSWENSLRCENLGWGCRW